VLSPGCRSVKTCFFLLFRLLLEPTPSNQKRTSDSSTTVHQVQLPPVIPEHHGRPAPSPEVTHSVTTGPLERSSCRIHLRGRCRDEGTDVASTPAAGGCADWVIPTPAPKMDSTVRPLQRAGGTIMAPNAGLFRHCARRAHFFDRCPRPGWHQEPCPRPGWHQEPCPRPGWHQEPFPSLEEEAKKKTPRVSCSPAAQHAQLQDGAEPVDQRERSPSSTTSASPPHQESRQLPSLSPVAVRPDSQPRHAHLGIGESPDHRRDAWLPQPPACTSKEDP
jgi:hypothetical protein